MRGRGRVDADVRGRERLGERTELDSVASARRAGHRDAGRRRPSSRPAVSARSSLVFAQSIFGGSTNDVWTFVTRADVGAAQRRRELPDRSARLAPDRWRVCLARCVGGPISNSRRRQRCASSTRSRLQLGNYAPDPGELAFAQSTLLCAVALLLARCSAAARDGCCAIWDAKHDLAHRYASPRLGPGRSRLSRGRAIASRRLHSVTRRRLRAPTA